MPDNPIAIAIPVFIVLILLEWAVSVRQKRTVYRFADAVTNLSCGISQQASEVFLKALLILPYLWVYEAYRIQELSSTWWGTHLLALFLMDLGYYWWHRWTHEMNIGWVTHVVHHQSEEYNLAVALRQSLTSSLTTWVFYLPLAVLGVHWEVYVAHLALNTLYQFWIHTETIRSLGPIGWIMNTPSHHRVHHGINPQYVDKNYAGVFIIWDRLFGSFEPEGEEVVYGTIKPLQSFNPFWANAWYFVLLLKDALAAKRWQDRLKVWVARPGWRPEGLDAYPQAKAIARSDQQKYAPSVSNGLALYVTSHFIPVITGLVVLLWFEHPNMPWTLTLVAGSILLANLSWGGLFERKRWAVPVELIRIFACGAGGCLLLASLDGALPMIGVAVIVTAGVASVAFLWTWRSANLSPKEALASK